jgi:hypothetical protein
VSLSETRDAIRAPRNPAVVSASASAASIERPGIQYWWISSSVPHTATAAATVAARIHEKRGAPGQAIAK